MKSTIKKTVGALLAVPLLVLGIGVFSAVPAYAISDCPTSTNDYTSPSDGCKDSYGNTKYYYNGVVKTDASAWKKANDEACKPNGGLRTGIDCSRANTKDQPASLFGSGGIVTTVINVLLFIIGILCVIMIIFGGIRYTTSTGDKNRVDSAKNTIIYAVVGLVVAIVAYALVNWVFGAVTGTGS